MEKEVTQLENRIKELTKKINARIKERLSFPLDLESRRALDYWKKGGVTGLFIATGKAKDTNYLDLLTNWTSIEVEVSVNGKTKTILIAFPLFPFTANAGTDIITATNGHHNLSNGDILAFTTTDTLPSPINDNGVLWVINATATTFKVSATPGGSAVNILDAGIGSHFYAKIN